MKTNSKMLEEICDKIGYKNKDISYYELDFYKAVDGKYIIVDEREIILTQEFMDKYRDYFKEKQNGIFDIRNNICDFIIVNLYNPTLYLYNTLGLGQKKENN